MIIKPALAAMLASGIVVSEAPKLILPKPAIIKAENIEFSKNLLAMPITLGMLPNKGARDITYLGTDSVFDTSASLTFAFSNPNNKTLIVAWAIGTDSVSSDQGFTVTIGGASATTVGSDFSYTGTASKADVQYTIGFSYQTSPGTSGDVVVTSLAATSYRTIITLAVWAVDGYTSFTKTGFNRNNADTLSSSITAPSNTHLIGYSAWKNVNNTNGYYHGAATMKVVSVLSGATVTGTLGAGRDWSGTAGIVEMLDVRIGATSSISSNRLQSFCICS